MEKRVLITGSSSGFGKLITIALLNAGHRIVASMRSPWHKNRAIANELEAAGAKITEIDVTSDSSVEHGVRKAVELAGGLDVLINNAGLGVIGLQEAFLPEDWRRLFDVNVFGVQRVNRAVLPHFRKSGSGLLVQVSSLLGRITIPFYGPYNASKWAVEAMSENYRTELSAFGVDVCIVEPGGFPTAFVDNLMRPSDSDRNAQYGEMSGAPEAALSNFENVMEANKEQDPQLVADAVVKLIDLPAGERPFRTVVDKLGMGEPINGYNEHLADMTLRMYEALGISGMLQIKK